MLPYYERAPVAAPKSQSPRQKGRYNQLSSYKTHWHVDRNVEVEGTTYNEQGSVYYQNTQIVYWNDGYIKLNTGGWKTVTTKRKMNQASLQFNLGFSVFQKNHEWFVTTPHGETFPFYEDSFGMARKQS